MMLMMMMMVVTGGDDDDVDDDVVGGDGKVNLIGKDDSTDHDRLIWVLVIAVLIG